MNAQCRRNEMPPELVAMAYLDDELAPEERRELELHALECADCRALIDSERERQQARVALLAAPAAPDLLRARIGRVLDAEDQANRTAARWRWALPGAAIAAAAAALVVFTVGAVGTNRTPGATAGQVAQVAPLAARPVIEVQGAGTVQGASMRLVGVRPASFLDQPAAQMFYELALGGRRHQVIGYVLRQAPPQIRAGQRHVMGGRELFVAITGGGQGPGFATVSHVDADQVGYVFTSPDLSAAQLLTVVTQADLITHASAAP